MNKIFVYVFLVLVTFSAVSAAPFNLPTKWILLDNGTSIDQNNNGYPDFADSVYNSSYADTANNSFYLNNRSPSYYLDYDNMFNVSINDSVIQSSTYWNNKAGTGVCAAGFYVSEVNSSGVVCVADQDTTYSAGSYIQISGTTIAVNLNSLKPALNNGLTIMYQNITNLPTCSGSDKLSFDGSVLSCENDVDTDTDTQLSSGEVKDFAWDVLGGDQEGISVTYNSTSNTANFYVNSTNLTTLVDVAVSSLQDGQALLYNTTSKQWENQDIVVDLSPYYNKSQVYNTSEVDAFFNDYYTIVQVDALLNNYYNKSESYNQTQINNLFIQYYNKTQVYNISEVDALVNAASLNESQVENFIFDTDNTLNSNFSLDADGFYYDTTNKRVGIGTSSPSTTLNAFGTIRSSTNDHQFELYRSDDITLIGRLSYSGQQLRVQGSDGIAFQDADTFDNWMTIESSGEVGIGTSSPTDYAVSADNLVVQGSGDTGLTIATTNTNKETNLYFANGTGAFQDKLAGGMQYKHDTNLLNLLAGSQTRMTLLGSNGNVGIGTSSPSEKLDVNGNVNVGFENEIYTSSAGLRKPWRLAAPNGKGVLELERGGVDVIKLSSDYAEHGHSYVNGNLVNFGIGTSSPQNKLDVAGGVVVGSTFAGVESAPTDGIYSEGDINIDSNNAFQIGGTDVLRAYGANVAVGSGAGVGVTGDRFAAQGNQAGRDAGDRFAAQGYFAGYNAGDNFAAQGYYAGYQAGNNFAAQGFFAGRNAGSDFAAQGYYAGYQAGNNFAAQGYSAGSGAGSNFAAQGYQAGSGAGNRFVAQGYRAGRDAGEYFAAQGYRAGHDAGNRFVAQGYLAGYGAGNRFVAQGYFAGVEAGDRFTAIGYESTGTNTLNTPAGINDSVAIGYKSEPLYNGHFVLQQANLNSNPLLQGNFSSGNVGIGYPNTANLAGTLDVNGTLCIAGDCISDWSSVAGSTNETEVEDAIFDTDNTLTSDFSLDTDGFYYDTNNKRVGIGTSSPSGLLDVANGLVRIQNNHANKGIEFYSGATKTGKLYYTGTDGFIIKAPDGGTEKITVSLSSTTAPARSFDVDDSAGTNLFHVGSTGNVGIGTTSPQNKLDVAGGVVVGSTFAGVESAPTDGIYSEGDINIDSNSAFQIGGTDVLRAYDANDSVVIYSGADETKERIVAVGSGAGAGVTGDNFAAQGYQAGYQAGGNFAAQGYLAGRNAGGDFAAQGYLAGRNAGGNFAAQGYRAGDNAGNQFVAQGYFAGYQAGSDFAAQGYRAGYQAGDRFTAIGYQSTRTDTLNTPAGINDSVAIGYGSEPLYNGHFVLQQANLNSNPLLQGNFTSGNVGIGYPNTANLAGTLDVNGTLCIAGDCISDWSSVTGSTNETEVEAAIFDTDNTLSSDFSLDTDGFYYDTNNKRVGIGTSSPTNKLEVVGSQGSVVVDDLGSIVSFTRPGTNYIRATENGGNIIFQVDGSGNALRIDDGGDIGIGTNSPSAKVSIVGDDNNTGRNIFEVFDSALNLRSTISDRGAQSWYLRSSSKNVGRAAFTTPGSDPGLVFFNANGTGRTQIKQFNPTGGLSFGTTTGSSSPDDQLVIKTNGNVGIGTSSPGSPPLTSSKLEIYENGNNVFAAVHEDAGTHKAGIHLRSGGVDNVLYTEGTNFYIDSETVSKAFTLANLGNVGIGTNTPQNKLDVAGGVVVGGTFAGVESAPTDGIYSEGDINIDSNSAFQIGGTDVLRAYDANGSVVIYSSADITKSKTTLIGRDAGTFVNGDENTAVGYWVGQNAGDRFTAFGKEAGRNSGDRFASNGYASGKDAGDNFAAIGYWAGRSAGSNFVAQGYLAGYQAGSDFVAQGYQAGRNAGSRFTAIGYESTGTNTLNTPAGINDSVAIGYRSEPLYNGHFVLQQANLNSNPLLQGNFSSGNVGVGYVNNASLSRDVNINDTMRLEPRSSAPSSPSLGDLYVDSDSNELCFYNSTAWVGMSSGGNCV